MNDSNAKKSETRSSEIYYSTLQICGFAFLLLAGYGLIRPASESIFLERFGSDYLPYAWISVAGCAGIVVSIYSRFAKHYSLATVLATNALINAALLVVLALLQKQGSDAATFVLYVWKDVYIVVLLENVWSWASVIFKLSAARWAYGAFCACGSAGSVFGNLFAGTLASYIGSEYALLGAVPFF
ncbi:MAG: hypothetical protein IPJ88_10460 [Myxococcales bacterium]|nr:MAG: hypothetical protein IPJ88_10460 [Myxococcales bacterium]